MTDTVLQQAAPAPKSSRKLALKIVLWGLVLGVLSFAWVFLLASSAPEHLNFSSAGMALTVFSPPLLLTFACWAMTRPSPTPPAAPVEASSAEAPARPVAAPQAAVRFRIGAWSALTPFGNTIETVEGTKARNKAFKPDKAILHPSGCPVHAGIINKLDLVAMGHEPDTRAKPARVTAMLCLILDDLHAQQATFASTIGGPTRVFWLVPPALIKDGDEHRAIFDAAWQHSAWRKGGYQLQMAAADKTAFMLLSELQSETEQSPMRFAIVIAADSMLDREDLAPALALAEVYSHASPQGFVPSEGGGGILLFNPAKTRDDLWATAAILGPLKSMPRTLGKDDLSSLMSAALAASATTAEDISFLVADADHRTAGSLEVIDAMAQVLVALDPLEHRISPMEYAGAFGAASDLIHLALAVELAGQGSVLALTSSAEHRSAVVINPA